MEKEIYLKALEVCSNPDGDCADCPCLHVANCTAELAKETIAQLNATETPKAKPKYHSALIFTKRTNMSEYCTGKVTQRVASNEAFNRMCEYYAKEREVQLIAMFRWENGKCFCKIKCPINPLPVKGEFETPSYGAITRFLANNGWKFKQKVYSRMFE